MWILSEHFARARSPLEGHEAEERARVDLGLRCGIDAQEEHDHEGRHEVARDREDVSRAGHDGFGAGEEVDAARRAAEELVEQGRPFRAVKHLRGRARELLDERVHLLGHVRPDEPPAPDDDADQQQHDQRQGDEAGHARTARQDVDRRVEEDGEERAREDEHEDLRLEAKEEEGDHGDHDDEHRAHGLASEAAVRPIHGRGERKIGALAPAEFDTRKRMRRKLDWVAACAMSVALLAACEEKRLPSPSPVVVIYSDACAPPAASGSPELGASANDGGGGRAAENVDDAVAVDGGAMRVVVEFDQRVRMRDGVELSADVYRPESPGHYGTILMRTPYTKSGERTLQTARKFASRGYVYIAMDVRGRGDSGGTFVPYVNDGQDGYDAIEWAAAQPWSNGKVGTIGASYPGKIQWLAALMRPPHLAAMVPMVPPADPFMEFPTGLPLPLDVAWYHFISGHVNQNEGAVPWDKTLLHVPFVTLDEAAGRPNPLWKEQFEHAKLDEYWDAQRYQNKYDKVEVPVLHVSGWYDDEQMTTPMNFAGMVTKGQLSVQKKQRLLMGGWGHRLNTKRVLGPVDMGPDALIDLDGAVLRFFDATLMGKDNGLWSEAPVRLFVMGDDRWVSEKEWPLARTRYTKYFLHSKGKANTLGGDGTLSTLEPSSEPADKYTYDPRSPTPFVTDVSFVQLGGPDDYRNVEKRDDVLVYTTDKLTEDTLVCGPVKAHLFASSSAKDTDFMVMLLDVWPNGVAQRLIDGMVRARFREGMDKPSLIEPGKMVAYDVDVWNTCQAFKKGHKIRVQVSSAAWPKYDRNPNTGDALGMGKEMLPAEQTIFHERDRGSYVTLPVIPAAGK